MKKSIVSVVGLSLLTAASLCMACAPGEEPVNLSIVKAQARHYHDSGHYAKDLTAVANKAIRYLDERTAKPTQKKLAIVLDIDETSLSNYPNLDKMDFGGTREEQDALSDMGNDPVIPGTLKLFNEAKARHVTVIFMTGRTESERAPTEANLTKANYTNWDKLILRDGPTLHVPAAVYKTAKRKELEAQGYDIIINMGDQDSDLRGGYADKTFKLPNPFYIIP